MIAVMFEVWPRSEESKREYLAIAAGLRPLLEEMDGFISVERFESISELGKILSLSLWRDEEAVRAWRQVEEHRIAQAKGRAGIFQNYRLRIVDLNTIRDYGMFEREQAPLDSRQAHG